MSCEKWKIKFDNLFLRWKHHVLQKLMKINKYSTKNILWSCDCGKNMFYSSTMTTSSLGSVAKAGTCAKWWGIKNIKMTKTITYMTPNFLPTRRHRLLWCHRGPIPIPGLLRPFILGVPGPGLDRPFDFGPGLDLADGLLRPEVQWDGLVQPGLNQRVLSLACGELSIGLETQIFIKGFYWFSFYWLLSRGLVPY